MGDFATGWGGVVHLDGIYDQQSEYLSVLSGHISVVIFLCEFHVLQQLFEPPCERLLPVAVLDFSENDRFGDAFCFPIVDLNHKVRPPVEQRRIGAVVKKCFDQLLVLVLGVSDAFSVVCLSPVEFGQRNVKREAAVLIVIDVYGGILVLEDG